MLTPLNQLSWYFPDQPIEKTEIVSVEVDGVRYTAFVRAQARAGYKEAARAFELRIAAELGASATHAVFRAGAEVSVYSNDDLLLTGFVDQKRPHYSARNAHMVITGRSKSGDLIDSDPDHGTGHFENKDPAEIGAELAEGYGATFRTDQTLSKLESYQLTPGASIFREIEKMARRQGMTLSGTADGDILITKPDGSKRHAGGVFEGQNLLVGNADHNWSNRHSRYSFKGQRILGHGARRLHMVATSKDGAVKRKRHKTVIHDDDGPIDDLKERATNRRNRAAGEALKATISTAGFRDQAGKIWEPGYLVWVESPYLDIAQDMLIEAVDYSSGPEGSLALLSLVDPRAFGGKGAGGGKGNKSGSEYEIDDSEAVDETPAD